MPLVNDEDLAEPLRLCDRSLRAVGNDLIADGRLADVLRRVAAFGLTLVRLDVRQESARHTEAVDAIARHLGLGSYAELDRRAARRFPAQHPVSQERRLAARRPAAGCRGRRRPRHVSAMLAADPARVARRLRHHAGRPRLGRARGRAAAARSRHRAAAAGGPAVRDRPRSARRRRRDERAAVDSLVPRPRHARRGPAGSDGRLLRFGQGDRPAGRGLGALQGAGDRSSRRAAITTCRSRSSTAAAAASAAAAGPTYLAIQSQPPGSVDGTLRVTEQGEMIQAKFGLPGIAVRTLEVYTTATLEATLASAARRSIRAGAPRWSGSPARRATGFRRTVYDDPRFLRYFSAATPEAELDALHIGSRPARRERRRRPADPARDSLAVRLDADPAAARVVARRRRNARRRRARTRTATSAARCTGSGRSSARRSI